MRPRTRIADSGLGAPALLLALVLALSAPPAAAGAEQAQKVEDAIEALRNISEIPERSVPPSLLRNAHGIAIVPEVIKVGFVVGGRHGRGVLLVRSESGTWSNPSFVTLTGGSLGFQAGAQSTDVVLVFKSRKSVEGIVRGKFTIGVDAAAAAGPVGRSAEAKTDAQLRAEIYAYSRSRGLFAGVSVDGSALQIDHEWNQRFYGRSDLTASRLFQGERIGAPAPARALREALAQSATSTGKAQ